MLIHGADGSPFVGVVTPPWIKNAENCSRPASRSNKGCNETQKNTIFREQCVQKHFHSWGINSYLNKTSITEKHGPV